MRQRGAKRRQRGHEEIAGGRKLDELVRQIERRPTIAVGIIRSGFIHGPGTISRRLSNDRVEPRRDEATTAKPLTCLRRLEKGAQAYPGLEIGAELARAPEVAGVAEASGAS